MTVEIRRRRRIFLALATALFCVTGTGRAADFDRLVRSSPFGRSAAIAPDGPVVQPLEFRGVMVDGGREYFSVHETKTRFSGWIGLNETGNLCTIRDYDALHGILTVEYQGSTLALQLKNAVILKPSPRVVQTGTQEPAMVAPEVRDGYRIGHVAEEIRRQRAALPQPARQ